MGFPFLFAICTAAMIAIGLVDIEKGREDARRFTEKTKVNRVIAETGLSADTIMKGKVPVESEDTVASTQNGESSIHATAVQNVGNVPLVTVPSIG